MNWLSTPMLRWLSGRGFDRLVGTITSASGWCPLPAEENQSLSQNGERQEEGARSEETVALGWEERLRRAGPGVQSEMLASKVLSFGFPVQLATLAPAPCLEGAPPLACTQPPHSTGCRLLPRPPPHPDLLPPPHRKRTHFLRGKTKPNPPHAE